ncbi:MAG: hypothetical protein ACJ790_02955 [Myxococcaceae bacterium]
MKKLIGLCAVAALAVAPLACDLEKTANQAQANKVMVATILSTPPVDIQPEALAGFDGSFDFGDAGSFDGGILPTIGDGGVVTIPGQTAAFVFFGSRKSQSLDTPPDGIAGGQASVTPTGGAVTNLADKGAGNYERTSQDDKNFKYESGADYAFTVVSQGETFTGKVEKAPALERIPEFHPPKGYVELSAGTSFTFTRPEPPANESRNLGFITVYPISNNGEKGDPTYNNIPKTPLDFLKLIAAPSEWRGSPVTIPATAFPEPKKTYVVVFQAVKTGGPDSANLFTGSAILAGTAEIAIVKTK